MVNEKNQSADVTKHEVQMKPLSLINFLAIAAVIIGLYVVSYSLLRFLRPNIINSSDGPVSIFKVFYHPLRYLDAERPDYHSATQSGWLKVKIDWINYGNGYLYFTWNSQETRAGVASSVLDFHEGNLSFRVLTPFHYVQANTASPLMKLINIRSAFRVVNFSSSKIREIREIRG